MVTKSRFDEFVRGRAESLASLSSRPASGAGVTLGPLDRVIDGDTIAYSVAHATIDRATRAATVRITGPAGALPGNADQIVVAGTAFWPLALARELDDLLLHLRFNEPEIGTLVFTTVGDPGAAALSTSCWLPMLITGSFGRSASTSRGCCGGSI